MGFRPGSTLVLEIKQQSFVSPEVSTHVTGDFGSVKFWGS